MAYVLRESNSTDRVTVTGRGDDMVYFKHESESGTSDKVYTLGEAEFDRRYVDESTLRLEEAG